MHKDGRPGERWQANTLKSPDGAHTSSTYPVSGLRSPKEHLRGIQTVKVSAWGQAGPGQGYHGGEDVQHAAGRIRRPWLQLVPDSLPGHAGVKTPPSQSKPSTDSLPHDLPPPPACPFSFPWISTPTTGRTAWRLCAQALQPGVAWVKIPVLPPI